MSKEIHEFIFYFPVVLHHQIKGVYFMVEQLYIDAFDRAKKVADMDRKERKNAIWDLAEEFKVINMMNM